MATDDATTGLDLTLSETVESLIASYRRMGMPMGQYVTYILVPAAGFFVRIGRAHV